MLKQCLAATAAGLISASCTLQPLYERPSAPIAPAYPTGPAYDRQPAATGAPRQGWPAVDIGWRDFFADDRLQAIVALALKNNQDLRVAMLNVEAARAQFRITRASLFPTVGGAASAVRQRTPKDLSASGITVAGDYSVGLDVSWEIDLFGRIRSLKDAALAQFLAQAQTRKAVEIALVSQVANQYLAMLADDDQLEVTRNTSKTAEESYRITKLSADNGIATDLDVSQAQGILSQAAGNYEAQMRARAQDENALVLLVGQPLPADLPPGRKLDAQDLLTDIPAGLPSDLLMRRPDIAAAEQTLRAANANIGAARAAFFPRISLTGDYGTLSPTLGGLFKPGSTAWSITPQITLPIFTGGSNAANLDLAQVQKRIEVANYRKAIETAFREVADGLAARGTYDRQISALDQNRQAQARRLELSDFRYRNGVDDFLSVLTAQTDLYVAQQALVTARLQRAANLVNLYQYLGGGWIEHSGDQPRAPDTATDPEIIGTPAETGSRWSWLWPSKKSPTNP